MERYKNFVRMEEMKNLLLENKQDRALEIAETIDIKKMKNVSELNIIAEVFWQNGELDKARECTLKVYERTKTRRVLMQLINIAVRLRNAGEAERYYEEYVELAPDDFYRHIFRYNIDKIKGMSYEVLIKSLQELKKCEYIDTWAYELAKLYHKAGQQEQCIEECNDIITWFGSGEVVDRARALRAYYLGELDIDKSYHESEEGPYEAEAESHYGYGGGRSYDYSDRYADDNGGYEDVGRSAAESSDEAYDNISPDVTGYRTEASQRGIENAAAADERCGEAYEAGMAAFTDKEMEALPDKEPEEPSDRMMPELEELGRRIVAESELALISDIRGIDIGEALPEEATAVSAVIEEAEAQAAEDTEAYAEKAVEQEAPAITERSRAEKEVEEALYSLLQEENELAERKMYGTARPELVKYNEIFKNGPLPGRDSYFGMFLEERKAAPEDYFEGYIFVDSVRGQIYKCMETLLNPQIKSISLVVSGPEKSGKTTIIRGIARILNQCGYLKEKKIAVSTGERINRMRLDEKAGQLDGCCLIIEKAGQLNGQSAAQLSAVRELFGQRTAVALEDTRSELNRLFRESVDLNAAFPNRIHLQRFSEEELSIFALWDFYTRGLDITCEACEALKARIKKETSRLGSGGPGVISGITDAITEQVETRNAQLMLKCAARGRTLDDSQLYIRKEDI